MYDTNVIRMYVRLTAQVDDEAVMQRIVTSGLLREQEWAQLRTGVWSRVTHIYRWMADVVYDCHLAGRISRFVHKLQRLY